MEKVFVLIRQKMKKTVFERKEKICAIWNSYHVRVTASRVIDSYFHMNKMPMRKLQIAQTPLDIMSSMSEFAICATLSNTERSSTLSGY